MIPMIKMFDMYELGQLLDKCASLMAEAYQETLNKELWLTSEQARMATEALELTLYMQEENPTLH